MSTTERRTLTTEEDFQYWVSDMDDALERFIASLPERIRGKLDYSTAGLDVLEGWILEGYANTAALLEPSASRVVDGAARYVGETFRKAIGGHWEVDLSDPKSAYFNLPILTGFGPRPTPICPHTLVTASADRRTGKFLRTLLENRLRAAGRAS